MKAGRFQKKKYQVKKWIKESLRNYLYLEGKEEEPEKAPSELKLPPEESSRIQQCSQTFSTWKYVNKTIFVWHKGVNVATNNWTLLAQEWRKPLLCTSVHPFAALMRKPCSTKKSVCQKVYNSISLKLSLFQQSLISWVEWAHVTEKKRTQK